MTTEATNSKAWRGHSARGRAHGGKVNIIERAIRSKWGNDWRSSDSNNCAHSEHNKLGKLLIDFRDDP